MVQLAPQITLIPETQEKVAAPSSRPGGGVSTPAPGPAVDIFTASPAPADLSAPVPSPFDDAEALEELEAKITTLAAHIHAATHRLLTLIADFDRRRGWELGGHRSCAHWLSLRTGIDLGTAREKVRTARALVGLPETSASMSRGELSFSKIRALTRVATKRNEGQLLEVARACTTAQLEREVRSYRRGSRKEEAELERERFESRSLAVFPDYEGMVVVRGRLPAEVGALLMRAIEAASDALYQEEREGVGSDLRAVRAAGSGGNSGSGAATASRSGPGPKAEADTVRAAAQRRADALGLVAERALAVGLGGGQKGPRSGHADDGEHDGGKEERGEQGDGSRHVGSDEGVRCPAPGPSAPISGSRAGRYQVMLHVEAETLKAEGEGGRSELDDGTRVSAETSQRIACDAGVVEVRHGADGSILDVGRRTRTIPPALRRALEVRDRGCRFPGCGLPFTEGHHIRHWAEGGETSLDNCALLCRHHHRLVHEGGWKMEGGGQDPLRFIDPRGRVHRDRSREVLPVGGRHGG